MRVALPVTMITPPANRLMANFNASRSWQLGMVSMVSFLLAMASNLLAMASNVIAMASTVKNKCQE